ncbi:MAG: ATP synthase F1 subunit delta [Phycisphaeraceae bacterium]|nr:ATP synthase F1 subunit delta [Phycisphaeraceae bacterium]
MPLIFSEPDALARTYAVSLFDLAQQAGGQSTAEQVAGELEDLLELARSDPAFSEFLSSRILSARNRERSLRNILSGRVHDLTLRFLLVLNEKDRLSHIAPISAAFDQLLQTSYGRVEVDLFTATPADTSEIESVRSRLREVLGKEPVVHAYTDPSMIGGLRLQIGDQLIDASIASSLRKLRERLTVDGAASVRARADRFLGPN